MGVAVVPAEIRTAASKLEAAAGGVRDHCPTEVSGVSDALPGSESAGAAGTLAGTWETRFRGWATRTDAQAKGLREAADTWATTDHTNAARMEKMAREGVL